MAQQPYKFPQTTDVDTGWAYSQDSPSLGGGSSQSSSWGAPDDWLSLGESISTLYGDQSLDDYIKEATKVLEKEQKSVKKDINKVFESVYPGLTGLTGEDALNRYRNEFLGTTGDIMAQGYANLARPADISSAYNTLYGRTQDITSDFSLANKLGGYSNIALDPPVVQTDVESIQKVGKDFYIDPATGQTRPELVDFYSNYLTNPEAVQFIYGGKNTADAIGRYYNSSGDVSGLMNYGSLA